MEFFFFWPPSDLPIKNIFALLSAAFKASASASGWVTASPSPGGGGQQFDLQEPLNGARQGDLQATLHNADLESKWGYAAHTGLYPGVH